MHRRNCQIIEKSCHAAYCIKVCGCEELAPNYIILETTQNLEYDPLMKNIQKISCTACKIKRGIWSSDSQFFDESINNHKSNIFKSSVNKLTQQLSAIHIEKEILTIAEYFSKRQLDYTKIPIDCIDLCYNRCFPQGAYKRMAELDQLLDDLKK